MEFFKVQQNPNFGKVIPTEVIRDRDSERVLAEQGHIDNDSIIVIPLTPEEEYLAIGEFEKAVGILNQEKQ